MGLLHSISENLTTSVITDWLVLKDVARLDSALCHHGSRRSFLANLKSEYVAKKVPRAKNSISLLNWMISRSIRAKQIAFVDTCFFPHEQLEEDQENRTTVIHQLYCRWIPISAKTMQSVTVAIQANQILNCVAEHCTHLTSLRVNKCDFDDSLLQILTNNKELTELAIPN